MSDDYDEDDEDRTVDLSSDDVAEIIEWAVGTAATILLMQHSPEHTNEEELRDRMKGFLMAVDNMLEELPDCLEEPAVVRANNAYMIAEENEEIVENFVEQLNDEDFINKLQEP